MSIIKQGSKVYVVCEAKLEDGMVCFKNESKDPLELVVGEGKFFPVLEHALESMKKGETKTINLEPKDAFGPHQQELILEVPTDMFKPDTNLTVGSRVQINAPSGKVFYATVIEANDKMLKLDLNHPLAGKKIIFTMTVVSVEEK